MNTDLDSALEREEFELHYLTEVDAGSGRVVGVEALLRWRHPERGLLFPLSFLAEPEMGALIAGVSLWTVRTACRTLAAWSAHPQRSAWTVSLNIEPGQLEDPQFAPAVADILRDSGVSPRRLWMEITERGILRDWKAAAATVDQLGALGVRFGLDNFGIGYASLAYLRQLPLSYLKTPDLRATGPLDARQRRILDAEIAMAKSLGLQVIAKGIETEAQREAFLGKGVDRFQGYLFGQPMPADALP